MMQAQSPKTRDNAAREILEQLSALENQLEDLMRIAGEAQNEPLAAPDFSDQLETTRRAYAKLDRLVSSLLDGPDLLPIARRIRSHIQNCPYQYSGGWMHMKVIGNPELWQAGLDQDIVEFRGAIKSWSQQDPSPDPSGSTLQTPEQMTLKWAWEHMPTSWISWAIGVLVASFLLGMWVGGIVAKLP